MTTDRLASGRAFIVREGRLLERRLLATVFDGADAGGVIDVLRGYRNADGGFGHGLEPDTRCPASLPIYVERALDAFIAAGVRDDPMIAAACEWLASVAAPDGAVPLAFPIIEDYPRADHWTDWTYAPGLNPTAGIAARLIELGVSHPWLDRATEWCFTKLESLAAFDEDAHALGEVLEFLAVAPDRHRAAAIAPRVPGWLSNLAWFRSDPLDPGYGQTPLHLAPAPNGPWSHLFNDAAIEGHLDRLERDQQDDGGWQITWQPPGQASTLEWRGVETLRALRVLRAYGRL
jgi:hypothetical protein